MVTQPLFSIAHHSDVRRRPRSANRPLMRRGNSAASFSSGCITVPYRKQIAVTAYVAGFWGRCSNEDRRAEMGRVESHYAYRS